jgi:hypothetical protein
MNNPPNKECGIEQSSRPLTKFTLDNCGKPQLISMGQPTISMQNKAINSQHICSHINGNFMLKNISPISMAQFLE